MSFIDELFRGAVKSPIERLKDSLESAPRSSPNKKFSIKVTGRDIDGDELAKAFDWLAESASKESRFSAEEAAIVARTYRAAARRIRRLIGSE